LVSSSPYTAIVNGTLVPSVNLSASPSGAICAGTTVNFTATASNGGSSPNYQFFVNGVSVQNGSSNTFSTNSLLDGQSVTVELSSSESCASPSNVNSAAYIASVSPQIIYYRDADNDGYSDGNSQSSCTGIFGYKPASLLISINGDCNDNNPAINPGALEICGNAIDENCDGLADGINSISLIITQPSCNNNNGVISVSGVNGGTFPYAYSLDGLNYSPVALFSTLAPGTYSVYVRDALSCVYSESVNLNNVNGPNCVPLTKLRVQDCGKLNFNLNSSIIADQVSGASQYEFQIKDAADNNVLATILNPTRTLAFSSVNPSIQWSTQYVVRVRAYVGSSVGQYGNACTIGTISNPNNTVPSTQLRALDCGNTSLTLTSFIQANPVTGATQYEFEFSQGATIVSTKLQSSLQCNLGSLNPSLNWNNTYTVRVRAYISSLQGTYGAPCNITIINDPALITIPPTQLVAANCGRLNYNYSTGGCAAVQVPNATQYEFQFLINNVIVGTRISGTRVCNFNQVIPALNPNLVYDCRVRAIISGVAGPFGAVCQIGFAPGSRFGTQPEDLELTDEEVLGLNISSSMEIQLMPNPYQGHSSLLISGNAETYLIRVFDLGGKLIAEERLNQSQQTSVGTNLSAGVYLLEVSDPNGNIARRKMVKTE
jgi:hypothetical protein